MNCRFIGCPCSGKTTTAAMVFALIKQRLGNAEFVPEFARIHIAKLRSIRGLRPEDPLNLTDIDQLAIFRQQVELEDIMSRAHGNNSKSIIISDTWSLSALLYMSKDARESLEVQNIIRDEVLPNTDLVFWPEPVAYPQGLDPNRVHSSEQALMIDAMVPMICSQFAPDLKVIRLVGSPDQRVQTVLSSIISRLST